jgi:hypothetical protein
MPRSRSKSSTHSVASQMLAFLLSFATLAGPLSTGAIPAPLAAATRASRLRLLPAAIPPEPPAAPEPQPTPIPPDDTGENKKWGEITIAQPKIWQYERVNSLLDGLLRDVQGISTSDLTALDPNASNGAAVKFVQSMLEIGVQYNQGTAVTNKIALQNYATQESVASTQIEANKAYLQQLNNQRTALSNQLTDAMAQNTTLQNQLATTQLDPTSTDYKALTARQQAAAGEVTSLQSELSAVNGQITSASTTTLPAAPTLTPTTGGSAPESANTFGSFLGNLPPDLTKNVVSQLQTPSLPATKRMDNFITLLYERLAREISALQDDVMRDPDNVPFLMQFDVGLYPSNRAKNHVGVVKFSLDCDGCKVYSIYPGQSSYNLANFEGASKRYSLWGALATLFGFGISADYRRQTDTLRGDLVQSVYTAGFMDDAPGPISIKTDSGSNDDEAGKTNDVWNGAQTADEKPVQRFGWYYGAAPFENLVTPGVRTTFAVVSVPRHLIDSCLKDNSWENTLRSLTAAAEKARGTSNDAAGVASKARKEADLATTKSKSLAGLAAEKDQIAMATQKRAELARQAARQAQAADLRAEGWFGKADEFAKRMEQAAEALEKAANAAKGVAAQKAEEAVTKAQAAATHARERAAEAENAVGQAKQEADKITAESHNADLDAEKAQADADIAKTESRRAAGMAGGTDDDAAKAEKSAEDAKATAEKADLAIRTAETATQSADAVPCGRKGILRARDAARASENQVKLRVEVNSDWVERNDPFYRHPNDAFHDSLPRGVVLGVSKLTGIEMDPNKKDAEFSHKVLSLILPGTDSIRVVPDLVLAERDRLHVLGMEYNPVYDPAPSKPAGASGAANPATPSPGTATASATGNGAGSTTVTVSGTGTASASTSGTASTTATATAASPPSTTPDKSTPSAVDPLTGCKQGVCAAILVKLAEPLDPNLVVTVKGLPLKRVRDWRGRGTSVLPPAQSSSDITPPGSTGVISGASASKLTAAENSPAASLLEADLPGPNTWMEVDSHRLLLNISKDLVGEGEEFPTIQIVDPAKRALFVPSELDMGFSELIMNGFHFAPRDGAQFGTYLNYHLRRKLSDAQLDPSELHPSGPYPDETFLPLFLPSPDDQPIYAYLGETGVQILIGLEKVPADPLKKTTPPKPKSWLAGKTQVVLEDRYLDLAWSLSCVPQSPMLVCDVPIQEIRDAYKIVLKMCNSTNECPAMPTVLDKSLSISTLQLWVDQYDPDGDDSFRSLAPANLGRFPVQPDDAIDSQPDVGYRPWHFESASPNWVKLTGCDYPEFPDTGVQLVTILGRNISQNFRTQILQTSGVERGCKWFAIPTLALTNPQVVIEYPHSQSNPDVSAFSPDVPPTAPPSADRCVTNRAAAAPCAPESLASSLFQPDFDSPIAIPHLALRTDHTSTVDQWTLDIPVRHVDCDDTLSLPDAYTKFKATWKIGTKTVPIREMTEALPENADPAPCHDRIASALKDAQKAAKDADKVKADLAAEYIVAKQHAEAAKNAAGTAKAQAEASAAKAKEAANAAQPPAADASKTKPAAAAPKTPAAPAPPKGDGAATPKPDSNASADAASKARTDAEAKAKADATAEEKAAAGASTAAADAKTKADAAAKAKADADAADAMVANLQQYTEIPEWSAASRTGQIVLELVVKRSDLRDLPLKERIQVLRGPLLSSIGKLPELGPSILPTTLSIVNVGTNQFTLQGKNAGVIDAVTVQEPDGTVSTIPTVSGAQIAIVTLTDSKAPAKSGTSDNPTIAGFSEDSVPGGTMIEIQGTNLGAEPGSVSFGGVPADVATNCWSSKSITVDVPLKAPSGPPLTVTVEVTVNGKKYKATKKFIVAGKPLNRVEPLTCPASNPDTQASGKDSASPSGPKAGSYSIVPLIALSKDAGGKVVEYMPLDVVDPNGKPLSFTVAEQKGASTTPKGVDSPTTTLTISKKTTVTPAPSTSNAAPGQ